MRSVSSTEFVRNPRAVFDQVVASGEPIVINRHGKPMVRVQRGSPSCDGFGVKAKRLTAGRCVDPGLP